ncbi:hypothetical protein, partial [Agrobacterium vitis]|uniref:hypothetical protein n=1 Tax=Agrobacterium vitis TaxID=373 RepID=UPI001AED8F94
FKSPMWITPLPPSLTALGEGSHGSILNGNYPPNRLSSAWKPTFVQARERDTSVESRPHQGCHADFCEIVSH